jgi:hypothetical protein
MVSFQDIQTAYYMVAATGVLVAAVFYVLNLRENQKNARVSLTTNLMQTLNSPAGLKQQIELGRTEWVDYEDFERKYGTENNVDSASARLSIWYAYNSLGELLKRGMVDEDTLYSATGWSAVWIWKRFESVIPEHRSRYMSRDQWTGFEFLANRMLSKMKKADPSFNFPVSFDKYVPKSDVY